MKNPNFKPLVILLIGLLASFQLFANTDLKAFPAGSSQQILTLHGSNTIGAKLGPNLIQAYLTAKGADRTRIIATDVANEVWIEGFFNDNNFTARVFVASHGSSTGFKGLLNKQADIAAASRAIKGKEVTALKNLGNMTGLESEHIVAIDGIAVVLHPSNPIDTLSVAQIADIFAGDIRNWSQLGGNDAAIELYARDNKSGTFDSFKSMVLGKKRPLSPSALRFESNDELSDLVSQNPNAIGFVGLPSVRQSKLLAISDGAAKALKPNQLTVATEDYALARRLYLYTASQSGNPFVADFINFAHGQAGQDVVADTGFVSQNITAVTPANYADLPQDFQQLTAGAKRLTINFRFSQGSAELDNKALKDIQRLIAYKKQNPKAKIVLIGFGDFAKTDQRAKLLSKLRSLAVRSELAKRGVYSKASIGYGESLPVASNDREKGRFKNRRVEVWVN